MFLSKFILFLFFPMKFRKFNNAHRTSKDSLEELEKLSAFIAKQKPFIFQADIMLWTFSKYCMHFLSRL